MSLPIIIVAKITCDQCGKPISKKDDLLVTSKYIFLMLRKYHRNCFADLVKMKTITSGFVMHRPINSIQHTVLVVFGAIFIWLIALFILMLGDSLIFWLTAIIVMIIPLPSLFVRLYSYLKYEGGLGD